MKLIQVIKAVLSQLAVIISGKDRYPVAEMWGFWVSYIGKDGETHYDQVETLRRYIRNYMKLRKG